MSAIKLSFSFGEIRSWSRLSLLAPNFVEGPSFMRFRTRTEGVEEIVRCPCCGKRRRNDVI